VSASLPEHRQVIIDGQPVRIEKAGLGRWAQALRILEGLSGDLIKAMDEAEASFDGFVQSILSLAASNTDRIIEAVALLTGLEEDVLREKVGLVELADILAAAVEVNRLHELPGKFGKLVELLRRAPASEKATG